ncbi:MAG: AlpA family phage regulatory protein [Deltaproteobacteria bacterium]|nr:AlpA family phage regulatory protein [Deltaproteobacteria bacterium]
MEEAERILRKPELFNRIPVSDPTIWRWEKLGLFPRRIQLGGNSVGWIASEVDSWLAEKAAARGGERLKGQIGK